MILFGRIDIHKDHLDACTAQQVDAIGEPILLAIDHPTDAGLDDEFGTLDTGRGRDIDGGTVAVVVATGEFRDRISLSMKHIGLGDVVLILSHILKPAGRSVITVTDDHLVLDHQRTDLTAHAVGVLSPDARHPQIAHIQFQLFIV